MCGSGLASPRGLGRCFPRPGSRRDASGVSSQHGQTHEGRENAHDQARDGHGKRWDNRISVDRVSWDIPLRGPLAMTSSGGEVAPHRYGCTVDTCHGGERQAGWEAFGSVHAGWRLYPCSSCWAACSSPSQGDSDKGSHDRRSPCASTMPTAATTEASSAISLTTDIFQTCDGTTCRFSRHILVCDVLTGLVPRPDVDCETASHELAVSTAGGATPHASRACSPVSPR